jgi:hypothetical protein
MAPSDFRDSDQAKPAPVTENPGACSPSGAVRDTKVSVKHARETAGVHVISQAPSVCACGSCHRS